MLSFAGDNATSNDTQTEHLDADPNNTFESVNRVRCFNHTLNLACKSLLKPFGAEKTAAPSNEAGDDGDESGPVDDDVDNDTCDSLPDLADVSDSGDDGEQEDDEDVEDEFEKLSDQAREDILLQTQEVRSIISKVWTIIS